MRNSLLIILVLAVTNCYAQHLKKISISYGEFFTPHENYYYQVICQSDSDIVYYSVNSENQKEMKSNEYSQTIMDIDKATFQQYMSVSSKNIRNITKEIEQISLFDYVIKAEFSDGTSEKRVFSALLYLLTEDASPSDKYKNYMNNMHFLLKSCFKELEFPSCRISL